MSLVITDKRMDLGSRRESLEKENYEKWYKRRKKKKGT